MSGIRVAAHLRELERASPWLLVKAMDAPKSVAALGNQKLGKQSLPAVSLMDGGGRSSASCSTPNSSCLPRSARATTTNIHGDSDYDLVLGDWKAVGGVRLHTRCSTSSTASKSRSPPTRMYLRIR